MDTASYLALLYRDFDVQLTAYRALRLEEQTLRGQMRAVKVSMNAINLYLRGVGMPLPPSPSSSKK